MKRIYIISVLAFVMSVVANAQKKYDDIYKGLPNMTLDQRYNEFMDFQRRSPFFANTYIQLGTICEHKMIYADPLLDIASAQYWSDNAHLFFGNFLVYYKSGDVKSNEEYYQNLNIPHAGKRITDEELMEYVKAHEQKCKNYRDSTLLVYKAMEKSRMHYNRCIKTYSDICARYSNYNEALLRYDAELEKQLTQLASDYESCKTSFAEYKRLIKLFPVANYRQFYDVNKIETFRLDGLTNSDFYKNRFYIWDYESWIADFRRALDNSVLPLRKRVEEINKMYVDGLGEYKAGGRLDVVLKQPYDDKFVFQLCKYDDNSLVRELFAYLEARRNILILAGDSLTFVDSSAVSLNRKMRHVHKIVAQLNRTNSALSYMSQCVSPERVARFADFFTASYSGVEGLRKMSQTEAAFNDGVLSSVLGRFVTNYDAIVSLRKQPSFSVKGRGASVPTWVVAEDDINRVTGNYITTNVTYDASGRVSYVAGYKKGASNVCFVAAIDAANATKWLTELKTVKAVRYLAATSDGCIVTVEQNNLPVALCFDDKGKQTLRSDANEGDVAYMIANDMTKLTHSAFNMADGSVFACTVDSLGKKVSEVKLDMMNKAWAAQEVSGGVMVIGQTDTGIVAQRVPDAGMMDKGVVVSGNGLRLLTVFRASAQQICLFMADGAGNGHLAILNTSGAVEFSTLK